jgi:hypothetical protein
MKNRIFSALLGLLLCLCIPLSVNAQAIVDNAHPAERNVPADTEQDAPHEVSDTASDAPLLAQTEPTRPVLPQNTEALETSAPVRVTDAAALDAEITRVTAILAQKLNTLPARSRVKLAPFLLSIDQPSTLGTYWGTQIASILANGANQQFTVIADPQADADYTLYGTLFVLGDTLRIFTWLAKVDDSTLIQVWITNFTLTPFIQNLLGISVANMPPVAGTPSAAPSDSAQENQDQYEPDSMDAPLRHPELLGETWIPRSLHRNDEDFFVITAPNDCVMIFETDGRVDTIMELFDAETGELLADDDDGGRSTNALIKYDVEAGKTYIVKVYGYDGETGSYRFHIAIESPVVDTAEPNDSMEQATLISVGEDVEAIFNSSSDVDWYRVDVVPSNAYLLISTRGNMDTFIRIYDADGTELDEDDDSGSQGNAFISVDISKYKVIYIRVAEFDNKRGAYTLHTELMQAGAVDSYEPDDDLENSKEIAVGESQERTFTIAEDVDNVRLTITEAGIYEIRAVAADGELDSCIGLFDIETEEYLDEDDDGGDNYDASLRIELEPGEYLISVFCLDDDPLANNAYTLSVTAILADED